MGKEAITELLDISEKIIEALIERDETEAKRLARLVTFDLLQDSRVAGHGVNDARRMQDFKFLADLPAGNLPIHVDGIVAEAQILRAALTNTDQMSQEVFADEDLDIQPLTALTLRLRRVELGLSKPELAAILDVNRRTPERWEAGHTPIPAYLPREIARLEAQQEAEVKQAAEAGWATIQGGFGPPVGWKQKVAAKALKINPDLRVSE